MRGTKLLLAASLAALGALLWLSCGGSGSPTAPAPPSPPASQPATTGTLLFLGTGCACVPPPYPATTLFVDGKAVGALQLFGQIGVTLAPGTHTWSVAAAGGATPVTIQAGGTVTVDIASNLGCGGTCNGHRGPGGSSGSGGVVILP